jgi:hypothetical protein
MWGPGPAIGTGCGAIAVIALEGAAWAGSPPPLPTAWSLVAIAAIARLAGVVAGNWAAVVLSGYAMYTGGFTLGHASDLAVWGKPAGRVAIFVVAALLTTMIAGWGEKGSGRPCSWRESRRRFTRPLRRWSGLGRPPSGRQTT